jgi:hypothetical protein
VACETSAVEAGSSLLWTLPTLDSSGLHAHCGGSYLLLEDGEFLALRAGQGGSP